MKNGDNCAQGLFCCVLAQMQRNWWKNHVKLQDQKMSEEAGREQGYDRFSNVIRI
jgi:hypothetical protein